MITAKTYMEWIGRTLRAAVNTVIEWILWLSMALLMLAAAHWLYTN